MSIPPLPKSGPTSLTAAQEVTFELLATHGGIRDLPAWLDASSHSAVPNALEAIARRRPDYSRAISLPAQAKTRPPAPQAKAAGDKKRGEAGVSKRSREIAAFWAFSESLQLPHAAGPAGAAPRTPLVVGDAIVAKIVEAEPVVGTISYPNRDLHPWSEQRRVADREVQAVRSSAVVQGDISRKKWTISVIDPRVMYSGAKLRRWAKDEQGQIFCCLEFLPYEKRPMPLGADGYPIDYTRDLSERPPSVTASRWANMQPHEREVAIIVYEKDQLTAEALLELNTAASLNKDLDFVAMLRTEHNRLLAICTNFPEQPSFILESVDEQTAAALGHKMYADVLARTQTLHDRGYIHGDQKDSNWMYTNEGNVTLIDFEHTRRVEADGMVSEQECNQPTFCPPEFHANGGRYGKPGDLWAVAASFVFLYGSKRNAALRAPHAASQTDEELIRSRIALTDFIAEMAEEPFESFRQRIASHPRPAAALSDPGLVQGAAEKRYAEHLTGFANALPDMFAFAMRSQLNRDPTERAQVSRAVQRSQEFLQRNLPAWQTARIKLQQALDDSASNRVMRQLL